MFRRIAALVLGAVLSAHAPAQAAEVQVAVAANFTEPAKAIAAAFRRRTGHQAVLSFGSSGQFYSQIVHGAPFQVFLSADTERPARALAEGYGVKGSAFVYATGRLALYSRSPGLVDARGDVLRQGRRFSRVAIANPALAPYGRAAVETLTRLRLYDAVRPKLVQGASITQAYEFVQSGSAELGFVALSQVVDQPGGSRWIVPEALHAPIEQGAVLLATGRGNPAAVAFMSYLRSAQAKAIIRRYGYAVR